MNWQHTQVSVFQDNFVLFRKINLYSTVNSCMRTLHSREMHMELASGFIFWNIKSCFTDAVYYRGVTVCEERQQQKDTVIWHCQLNSRNKRNSIKTSISKCTFTEDFNVHLKKNLA